MLVGGQGVPKNETAGAGLFRKACDAGELQGCLGLGYLTQNGVGMAKDPVAAITIYQKVCDGGMMEGCTRLGYAYSRRWG
jgi:TPR repeat protein